MVSSRARRRLLVAGLSLGAAAAWPWRSGSAASRYSAEDTEKLFLEPIPAQVPAKEALAQLPDVKLWYWDTGGAGEPIVLLHPMTGSGLVWSYQQPVFAKAGYHVIGYSRRGFRNSESGPSGKVGTASEDLHRLLDALKIGKFHAVSSAAGAFVAADYAISHPERLHTLTLACTMLGIEDGDLGQMTRQLRAPGFEALPHSFRELGPTYRALNPEGTRRWEELEHSSKTAGVELQRALANKITPETLRKLTMPTLLISGGADLFAPPPVARRLAQHIPSSELVVLPECGHSAYWEQPTRFNEAVLNFLRRHRA